MLLPIGLALVYLLASPFYDDLEYYLSQSWVGYVQLTLFMALPVLFVAAGFIFRHHTQRLMRFAGLSSCILAPLAILNAWTLAPGPGVGYGGYRYFIHWLTQYPNFGPINIEVLLGIICVLVSSLVPAVFAAYVLSEHPRRMVVLALLLLDVTCLIAVIIKLDIALLPAGFSINDPVYYMGPVLRIAGAISMTAEACLKINPKE
jgi:hypothetical protein